MKFDQVSQRRKTSEDSLVPPGSLATHGRQGRTNTRQGRFLLQGSQSLPCFSTLGATVQLSPFTCCFRKLFWAFILCFFLFACCFRRAFGGAFVHGFFLRSRAVSADFLGAIHSCFFFPQRERQISHNHYYVHYSQRFMGECNHSQADATPFTCLLVTPNRRKPLKTSRQTDLRRGANNIAMQGFMPIANQPREHSLFTFFCSHRVIHEPLQSDSQCGYPCRASR